MVGDWNFWPMKIDRSEMKCKCELCYHYSMVYNTKFRLLSNVYGPLFKQDKTLVKLCQRLKIITRKEKEL
jgi:hypothetical protein